MDTTKDTQFVEQMNQLNTENLDTDHVRILWLVMENLRDTDQLEESLSRCLDLFCKGTRSDKGTIWMLDEQSDRTIAINVYGTYDATGESAARGEGLVGRVIGTGKTEMHTASEVSNLKMADLNFRDITG